MEDLIKIYITNGMPLPEYQLKKLNNNQLYSYFRVRKRNLKHWRKYEFEILSMISDINLKLEFLKEHPNLLSVLLKDDEIDKNIDIIINSGISLPKNILKELNNNKLYAYYKVRKKDILNWNNYEYKILSGFLDINEKLEILKEHQNLLLSLFTTEEINKNIDNIINIGVLLPDYVLEELGENQLYSYYQSRLKHMRLWASYEYEFFKKIMPIEDKIRLLKLDSFHLFNIFTEKELEKNPDIIIKLGAKTIGQYPINSNALVPIMLKHEKTRDMITKTMLNDFIKMNPELHLPMIPEDLKNKFSDIKYFQDDSYEKYKKYNFYELLRLPDTVLNKYYLLLVNYIKKDISFIKDIISKKRDLLLNRPEIIISAINTPKKRDVDFFTIIDETFWEDLPDEFLDKNPEVMLAVVKKNGLLIKLFPKEIVNNHPNVIEAALAQNGYAIRYIENPTPEMKRIAYVTLLYDFGAIPNALNRYFYFM